MAKKMIGRFVGTAAELKEQIQEVLGKKLEVKHEEGYTLKIAPSALKFASGKWQVLRAELVVQNSLQAIN